MDQLETMVSEAMGDVAVSEVIRPAAVVPEDSAHAILMALAQHDVRAGGRWESQPNRWQLWDRPWNGTDGSAGTAQLLGALHVIYGTPTRHEITIYRATITPAAVSSGMSITDVCDAALQHGGLALASCPRASLHQPPAPLLYR